MGLEYPLSNRQSNGNVAHTHCPFRGRQFARNGRAVKERREFEIYASPLQVTELYGRVPPT